MFFKYPKKTFRLNIDPYIPIDDIVKITEIANSFVQAYGMSDNIGLVSYGRN